MCPDTSVTHVPGLDPAPVQTPAAEYPPSSRVPPTRRCHAAARADQTPTRHRRDPPRRSADRPIAMDPRTRDVAAILPRDGRRPRHQHHPRVRRRAGQHQLRRGLDLRWQRVGALHAAANRYAQPDRLRLHSRSLRRRARRQLGRGVGPRPMDHHPPTKLVQQRSLPARVRSRAPGHHVGDQFVHQHRTTRLERHGVDAAHHDRNDAAVERQRLPRPRSRDRRDPLAHCVPARNAAAGVVVQRHELAAHRDPRFAAAARVVLDRARSTER